MHDSFDRIAAQWSMLRLTIANHNRHHAVCVQKSFQGGAHGNATRKERSDLLTPCKAGVKDVITLFHSPNSPASMRVHTLLKQTAAAAQSTATQDQASSHPQQSKVGRSDFELGMHFWNLFSINNFSRRF